MRSALLISLAAHLAIGFISMQIVRFRHVRFVPRAMYTVRIITPHEIEKPPTDQKPASVVTPQEQEEREEMEPPPEKPKAKPREKKPKKKDVPTTELRKIEPSNEQPPVQEASTGEIVFDAEEFPFGYYISAMKRKIAAHWIVSAASKEASLYCRIYFRVMRNGEVVSPDIEESSGSFVFDQAALRAVVQASPLPPLPGGYKDGYLGVHFSFSYEKR